MNDENAAREFAKAVLADAPPIPKFSGRGVVIAAGGPYTPSAYVVVRLLRHFGVTLPIEIWHAGPDEIPAWARPAFAEYGVTFEDVMHYCPNRPLKQMRGWPIKAAALLYSRLNQVMFIDADCFPVCNLEFLFDVEQFRVNGAIFWPDNKRHKLLPGGAIWQYTGLEFNGDSELETGLFLVDKTSCWKELNLAGWMNEHSDFWYQHVLGDKDTFYLSWRKLKRPYFLAPACHRVKTILTRHFWLHAQHLADHRTGTSKYALPYKRGLMSCYLTPYKYRPGYKNALDEVFQRFVTKNFAYHTSCLKDLNRFYRQGATEP